MEPPKSQNIWEWVKAISSLIFVGVISYKIYLTPINLSVDFPTLLSLLLALFSVGLAALFYFKATETSNTFYDNTYNFTKDIAQLLVKIESGFGEKLRHLDEGYSSMRDYIQQLPKGDDDNVREKIEEEKEEIKKVVEERNELIRTLLEKSQLHDEEKQDFLQKLQSKESELEEAQKEMAKMRRKQIVDRVRTRKLIGENADQEYGFRQYTHQMVVMPIGIEVIKRGSLRTVRGFNKIRHELPNAYLDDLEERGYVDENKNLTPEGIQFLKELVSDFE